MISKYLKEYKTVAVVGISDKPERPSHNVAKFLKENGYKIFPVNPRLEEVLGEKCYPSLLDIPEEIDIVDVFRKAVDIPPIAEEAIKIKAKLFWMQLGIVNEDAATKLREAGIDVIMDKCIKIEHARYIG